MELRCKVCASTSDGDEDFLPGPMRDLEVTDSSITSLRAGAVSLLSQAILQRGASHPTVGGSRALQGSGGQITGRWL